MANEIKITYETLFEILRREKNREELQPLDPAFFDDVSVYIQKKKEILQQQNEISNVFATAEKEKLIIQINNIRKILREIYDRREKKIINMALIKTRSRSNLVDTSALLPQEQGLFSTLASHLESTRINSLNYMFENEGRVITNASEPAVENGSVSEPEVLDDTAVSPISVRITKELESEEKQDNVAKSLEQNENQDTKRVKFLEAISKFVGPDLEIYGPYIANDNADLPLKIAEILINKGKAEVSKEEGLIRA